MAGASESGEHLGRNGREVRDSLLMKNKRSQALTLATGELMNSGSAASLEMPFPVLMEAGDGPFLIDADGNRYIDFQIGFGSMLLGHRHPLVQSALLDQAANRGWQFGLHNPNQVKLADQLIKGDNCAERVIFCNSGTESTMYAIRVARAFSGRPKLGVFDGFYHGAHDYGIGAADPNSPRDAPVYQPIGAGVLPAIVENQIMLPYRSDAAFDLIRQHKDDLAMVMIEGVQSSNPHEKNELTAYLQELKSVCAESDVLFMMDEVITGFRLAYGGAQEYFDVQPDLATYGKVLGGGLPIGAVGGRADIMKLFNSMAMGDKKGIMSGGTFSGNPLTMAAGVAQTSFLDENRAEIYPRLNSMGQGLAEAINQYAREQDMGVQVLNAGSMFQIYFNEGEIWSARDTGGMRSQAETDFYLHLLDNGVLIPGTRRSFISYVHTPELVDEATEIIKKSLNLVRQDDLF
jgi:glutamate-1-semialdehyde 2,1-aminomutase